MKKGLNPHQLGDSINSVLGEYAALVFVLIEDLAFISRDSRVYTMQQCGVIT